VQISSTAAIFEHVAGFTDFYTPMCALNGYGSYFFTLYITPFVSRSLKSIDLKSMGLGVDSALLLQAASPRTDLQIGCRP